MIEGAGGVDVSMTLFYPQQTMRVVLSQGDMNPKTMAPMYDVDIKNYLKYFTPLSKSFWSLQNGMFA